jgi:hypothetical protein
MARGEMGKQAKRFMLMSRAGASFDLYAKTGRDCSKDSNDPKLQKRHPLGMDAEKERPFG